MVDEAKFNPSNLDEIAAFEQALIERYGTPDPEEDPIAYRKRAAEIESLDKDQQEAYFDATDARAFQIQTYAVGRNISEGDKITVQENKIEVDAANTEYIDKWNWNVSEEVTVADVQGSVVDVDSKAAVLKQKHGDLGDISTQSDRQYGTSTVGTHVIGSHWLFGDIYSFAYEMTWGYSYVKVNGHNYDKQLEEIKDQDTGVDVKQVDYSFNGSDINTNTNDMRHLSEAEGEFEHEKVGSNDYYYPTIELKGNRSGIGTVVTADAGD